MGKIADELRAKSKRDNVIIVGSEIREALGELDADVNRLRELLKVAVCPECDGSGIIKHQIAEDAWQEQQCQWCAEAKALEDK